MTRSSSAVVAAIAGLALACSGARAEQRGAAASPPAGAPQASADGTAATGEAQAAAPAEMPKQPEAKELPEVVGRVTAVSGSELRIQPQGQDEVSLRVDPANTSIDLDGRQATLNDLAPGTEVRASYEEAKGGKQALAVHGKTGDTATAK